MIPVIKTQETRIPVEAKTFLDAISDVYASTLEKDFEQNYQDHFKFMTTKYFVDMSTAPKETIWSSLWDAIQELFSN